jgi:hypothetical protein
MVNNAAYDLDDPYHVQDVPGFDMSVASLFPPQFFDPLQYPCTSSETLL